jgi:apolipoprotein N-acyltransferase
VKLLGKLPPLKWLTFIRCRYLWAILAGLLLAASLPKISIAGLAWVAPGLILLSAVGTGGKRAFRIGYVAGLTHYLASIYWLLLIPVRGFPILGWAALSGFMALYPALWTWLAWKLFPAKLSGEGSASYLENLAEQFLAVPWARRMFWAITGAALWVALEMTSARFLGGFPWNLLGSSQYKLVPLIQIASVTGIYGLSFLVVWSALSLLCAGMVVVRHPAKRSAWMAEIILPMLAVVALYVAGYQKLLRPEEKTPQVTVALIQPSIPQSLIWDPQEDAHRFQQLLQLSQSAAQGKPDIIIWPEAALPRMLRYDQEIYEATTELARTNHAWMIVGSDDEEPRPQATSPRDADHFNASFLVSPDGRLVERYKKRNLVIFGEYLPFSKWLPFLKYFTPIDGFFTPGDRITPFIMPDLKIKVSVLICFEDVFPHFAREYVDDDTDFLINITNDGWFGEGAAQWQQGAAGVFRAVENGLPLVCCSNNGLTCWADRFGRLRQIFEADQHGIYGEGYLLAQIPVLAPGEKRAATYYRAHGDVFGWGCTAFVVLQLARIWAASRLRKPLP